MSIQQHYQLKLTFSGPFITQAAGTIALGLDVEMQKDFSGSPVINGSLIKGHIRHILNDFSELVTDEELSKEDINRWFGTETSDKQFTPKRTQVDFDFYWKLITAFEADKQRTRIAINSATGTVKEGALQITEDCFPLNSETPVFLGNLTARLNNKKEQKRFKQWIDKALEYIPAMGSFKGVGWGQLKTANLDEVNAPQRNIESINNLPEKTTRFGIQLELDRPFCLGRPRTAESNQIVSDDFIAGNVIKGLIARQYEDNADLLAEELCFNDLIISHALAMDKNQDQRPMPIPLSLAIYKEKVVDMAGLETATEQINWEQAPKFSPDWKTEDKEKIQQKTSKLKRLLVLRTEINKQGISEEGKLFSLECIDPQQHYWCADIDLINIAEQKRPKVLKELQQRLANGLYGIGKTKAQAKISFRFDKPYQAKTQPLVPGRQIITLITAARILPPDLSIPGTNSANKLKQIYTHYWQKILSQEVRLENYFAQQTLSSSYYHQIRNKQIEKAYYPEWLSNAGSVFILIVKDQTALKKLQYIAETGLPAHSETDDTAANWKTTPYLPEHGYGEIQINNPEQLNLPCPKKEETDGNI